MKPVNLVVAECHLSAAHDALLAELKEVLEDTYAVWDAESLTVDALAQVRAEIKAREDARPQRYDWLGGAA